MTNSINDIRHADVLLVAGSNTTESHPVLSLQMKAAVKRDGAKLILLDPRRIELANFAYMHLRQFPGTDVAVVNSLAYVILSEGLADQAFIESRTEGFDEFRTAVMDWPPDRASAISGVPVDDIVEAARLYGRAENAAIFWAMGITQHTTGTDNVKSLANLALLTGNFGRPGTGTNPLRGQNNVQGACDLGGLPNVFPGYQSVSDEAIRSKFAKGWGIPFETLNPVPGLTVTEIMDAALNGKIRAIYIMGENPMLSDPNLNHVRKALEAVDFLVQQDIFMNETAEMADVILPGASFAEKEGTFTSTERRVQRVRKALAPYGEARPDWMILCDLARRMGFHWEYDEASQVFDELATLTPQYAGISHERLEAGGLQWPCPERNHPGTPVLHAGKFARGKGLFSVVDYAPPAEEPDSEYPLVLSTGRVLFHWHGGTLTHRSPGLNALAPFPEVEVHPEDAIKLEIKDGDPVKVSSRRGIIRARALLTRRSPPGTIFLTFHFAEAPANLLTSDNVDPVAKIPEYKVSAVRLEPDRD